MPTDPVAPRTSSIATSSARTRLVLALCAVVWSGCGTEDAPKVPHLIEERTDESCLTCHETGANGAPTTPHPSKTDCLGCHE